MANPKVSVFFCRPKAFHGLMLGGKIEIVEDSAVRRSLWDSSWRQFYPKGPDDPDHTVLRLLPTVVRGWKRGTKFEYRLDEVVATD
jgi:general stress protein 26